MALNRNSVCNYCVPPKEHVEDIHQHLLVHSYRCDICIIDLINPANLVYHFKTYHKSLCMICEEDIGYDNTSQEEHIRTKHAVYLCNICHECFTFESDLEDHYNNPVAHIHRCQLCRKDFPSSNEFWHHCFVDHRVYCPMCSAVLASNFANKQQWDNHLKQVHQLFPCPSCYDVLYSANLLFEHFNNMHRVRCVICKEAFASQGDMEAHFNKAHQIKCLLCDQFFQTETSLKMHHGIEHEIKCTKKIPNKEGQIFHSNVSDKIKCFVCDVFFPTETNLKVHHDREHTSRCTICGIVLNNDVQLERHEKAVHQMKCAVCNVRVNMFDMQVHFNAVHQISCDFCDKVCTSLTELKIHYEIVHDMPLMVNIKDNPTYNCTVCEEAFLNETGLVEHYEQQHLEQ